MYVGDSITDTPPLAAVKAWGGVSLSFNGNGYSIAAAEFAASPDAEVQAQLAQAFAGGGRQAVEAAVRAWPKPKKARRCAARRAPRWASCKRVVDLLVDRPCPTIPTMPHMGSSSPRLSRSAAVVRSDEAHRTAVDALGALFERAVGVIGSASSRTTPTCQAAMPSRARAGCRGIRCSAATTARNPMPRFQVPSVASSCEVAEVGEHPEHRAAATRSTGRPRPRCPAAARARGWRRCRRP